MTIDNHILKKNLGKRIKKLRKDKRLTQKQLANKINCSYPQLNKYECGMNAPPIYRLVALSEALDCTIDYLIVGHGVGELPISSENLKKLFVAMEELEPDFRKIIENVLETLIPAYRLRSTLRKFQN